MKPDSANRLAAPMKFTADWLLDADDVVAHLCYAAANIEIVVITGPNAVFVGGFCYPDDQGILVTGEGRPDLPRGTAVCVEYLGPADQYRFYSQVIGTEPGGVRIDLPRAVERSDRRLAGRQGVGGHRGFGFRLQESGIEIPIQDIASGGLGLSFPRALAPPQNELLDGEILLPGEAPMRVCLEVRHARPRGPEVFVGTMITGMVATDRVRLARFLVAWGRVNG